MDINVVLLNLIVKCDIFATLFNFLIITNTTYPLSIISIVTQTIGFVK